MLPVEMKRSVWMKYAPAIQRHRPIVGEVMRSSWLYDFKSRNWLWFRSVPSNAWKIDVARGRKSKASPVSTSRVFANADTDVTVPAPVSKSIFKDALYRSRLFSPGLFSVIGVLVSFALGGFEVPVPGARRPAVVRALNVLRQYDEADVPAAWATMAGRLAPGGLLVEGTCDELGRVCSWIALDSTATPRSLTVSLRLASLDRPSIAAERLPKALIHHNVEGERVHAFLTALDTEWERAAAVSPFGPVHRWQTALRAMDAAGWPVRERARWRLGEVTVPWEVVAPGA